MKILHLVFENFQDVAGLLSRSHKIYGDEGVLVTMAHSKLGFPDGILLNYPLLNSNPINLMRRICKRNNVNVSPDDLKLKIKGDNFVERFFFKSRDLIWLYRLQSFWRKYDFDSFDIYHFDGGIPFIYGDRILRKLKNKKIVAHFFGSDLRKWGMNPYLKEYAHLKFTSEVDHIKIDPSLVFVPIPFEAEKIKPREKENKILRVGHSPTRRAAKGTNEIIEIVGKLKKKIKFEFILIEGVPHKKCMELKATCDIGIDQIGNYAGTAYGRSGLEFLALGIPTITEIPKEYEYLLPNHPFINANKKTFEDMLYTLLTNSDLRNKKRLEGLQWVREFPNPKRVIGLIYNEYRKLGWIK
ncbi:MAG: glycosyltransferase [candidate division WOR-3 bacterium]